MQYIVVLSKLPGRNKKGTLADRLWKLSNSTHLCSKATKTTLYSINIMTCVHTRQEKKFISSTLINKVYIDIGDNLVPLSSTNNIVQFT